MPEKEKDSKGFYVRLGVVSLVCHYAHRRGDRLWVVTDSSSGVIAKHKHLVSLCIVALNDRVRALNLILGPFNMGLAWKIDEPNAAATETRTQVI